MGNNQSDNDRHPDATMDRDDSYSGLSHPRKHGHHRGDQKDDSSSSMFGSGRSNQDDNDQSSGSFLTDNPIAHGIGMTSSLFKGKDKSDDSYSGSNQNAGRDNAYGSGSYSGSGDRSGSYGGKSSYGDKGSYAGGGSGSTARSYDRDDSCVGSGSAGYSGSGSRYGASGSGYGSSGSGYGGSDAGYTGDTVRGRDDDDSRSGPGSGYRGANAYAGDSSRRNTSSDRY